MTNFLPPALHAKVAELAAELDQTVEEFIIQTLAERVEVAEFFRSRVGTSKPGELTELMRSGPNRAPFLGDEIPPDVAERIEAQKRSLDGGD